MQLESSQLLCTACYELGCDTSSLYKKTHTNHPSAVWARQSLANAEWLYAHAKAMFYEWQRRGHNPHKSFAVSTLAIERLRSANFPELKLTLFPLCMPDELYEHKYVPIHEAPTYYRQYYFQYKSHLAAWDPAPKPLWWQQMQLECVQQAPLAPETDWFFA